MGTHVQVIDPATGALLQEVPADDDNSVAAKVQRARVAQRGWAGRPLEERIGVLSRFAGLVRERSDELARTTTRETGKPITQSRNEVRAFVEARVPFFLSEAPSALAEAEVHREAGMVERIAREPLGVVANVSAWNYPYFVGGNVFVPALLAGNAVVYKPSEYATLTGLALAAALRDAGLPEGVFEAVVGNGEAGAALVAQPVDGVFFTGSYATGRKVAAAAAERLVKVQLELGGKDPAYVAPDAPVAAAATALADGAFYNAGQSCCAVERIYVHASIADEFVERFVAEARALRRGDPLSSETTLGPMARREAALVALEAQVADAVSRGARVVTGGSRSEGPGYWFEPTVLVDVDHSMQVMREETFGPVIGIQRVGSDEEALALMVDTRYGLTAAVYTPDEARAHRLLSALPVGSAYWNCCDRVSPRLPWSGRNHSGLGLTLSREGITAFTHPKAWHLRAASA